MDHELTPFVDENAVQPGNQSDLHYVGVNLPGVEGMDQEEHGQSYDYHNMNMSEGMYFYDFWEHVGEEDLLPADFPHPVKATLILLYVIVIITSIIGNLFVILVVVKFNKMRTVTNVFLVSLAISDILIAGANMPIQLNFLVQNEWTMGQGMCCFSNYIQGVVIMASILTLTGIAIDRYYAICYPLSARHVHTLTRAAVIITVFWSMSFLLLVPQIFIMRVEPLLEMIETGLPAPDDLSVRWAKVCVEYFHHRWQHVLYTMVIYVVLYVFPVVTMLLTYGRISCTLWRRQPIGETPDAHDALRRQREKKRIVRMLVVIVALFVINWFPFFTAQVWLLFNKPFDGFRVFLAFVQVFGYSNACTNPIVYCFMNSSFRQHLFKLVCCNCFWRYNRRKRRRSSTSLQPVVTSNSTHMSVA